MCFHPTKGIIDFSKVVTDQGPSLFKVMQEAGASRPVTGAIVLRVFASLWQLRRQFHSPENMDAFLWITTTRAFLEQATNTPFTGPSDPARQLPAALMNQLRTIEHAYYQELERDNR